MKRLLVFALLLSAVSCTNIQYLGDEYPPTDRVDVYFSEADVEIEYRVMGHLEATAGEFVNTEKMLDDIKKKAMEKGADAIIVLGLDEYVVSSSTSYTETTKDEGDKSTVSGSTSVSTTKEKEVKAVFIKYKRNL